jgi:hypothetical protein
MTQRADLVGSWALTSAQFEFSGGEEAFEMYGPNPSGRVIFGAAGRMMVLITPAGGGGQATTPGGLMAYSGRFEIGEGRLVTQVDVASLPAWVGTEQVRRFGLEGDVLSLFTAEMAHPRFPERKGQGVLRWRRES